MTDLASFDAGAAITHGRNKNYLIRKLPRTKVRCYLRRGDHGTKKNHDFKFKAADRVSGRCDCSAKCVLCDKAGLDLWKCREERTTSSNGLKGV